MLNEEVESHQIGRPKIHQMNQIVKNLADFRTVSLAKRRKSINNKQMFFFFLEKL